MPDGGKQEWKDKVWKPATERSAERQDQFETTSGLAIDPI